MLLLVESDVRFSTGARERVTDARRPVSHVSPFVKGLLRHGVCNDILVEGAVRRSLPNTALDVDAHGNICAMTVEHASDHAGAPEVLYERVQA
jgi:hypothetical protein